MYHYHVDQKWKTHTHRRVKATQKKEKTNKAKGSLEWSAAGRLNRCYQRRRICNGNARWSRKEWSIAAAVVSTHMSNDSRSLLLQWHTMHFFFLRQFVPLPSSKGRSDLLDLKTKRLDLPVRIRSVEEGLCYSRTIESLLVNPFRFFYSFTSEHGSWFGYTYVWTRVLDRGDGRWGRRLAPEVRDER